MLFIIDNANIKRRVGRSTKRWFHLTVVPQDAEALKKFGKKVGLNPKWIQVPPKTDFIHFDVSAGMRHRIIKAGAVPLTTKEMIGLLRRSEELEAAKKQEDQEST